MLLSLVISSMISATQPASALDCIGGLKIGALADKKDAGSVIIARFVLVSKDPSGETSWAYFYETEMSGEYYQFPPSPSRAVHGSKEFLSGEQAGFSHLMKDKRIPGTAIFRLAPCKTG